MPSVESISVKIKVDKRFGKLVRRTCRALKSLGDDKLVTIEDVDTIIGRVLEQLRDMITIGKVKEQ